MSHLDKRTLRQQKKMQAALQKSGDFSHEMDWDLMCRMLRSLKHDVGQKAAADLIYQLSDVIQSYGLGGFEDDLEAYWEIVNE